MMKIHGLSKLTLLDYPEHTACTLFCGGCNFRCPFCQNSTLARAPEREPVIPRDEIMAFLKKRSGILQGVCITGGEPTLHEDLPEWIRQIRHLGYLVKLDTNGYRPDMLEKLLADCPPDYVAMDIKSSRAGYGLAAGLPGMDTKPVEESVRLLRAARIPVEFRTTLVKGIHTEEDIRSIGRWLAGTDRYFLQHFEDSENVPDHRLSGFSKQETEGFLKILRRTIPGAAARGL